VFPFFERPENLAVITPSWLGFRIVTTSPIQMKEGTVIEYSIRVMGIRTTWKSRISVYDPPCAFADEQLEGPYTFWHHTHRFIEVDGGTLLVDEIRYSMPFSILGQIVHSLVVRKQLQRIFRYRAQAIERMFGCTEPLADTA
jgi:ligand-binding SRPBCC domain-containing protein